MVDPAAAGSSTALAVASKNLAGSCSLASYFGLFPFPSLRSSPSSSPSPFARSVGKPEGTASSAALALARCTLCCKCTGAFLAVHSLCPFAAAAVAVGETFETVVAEAEVAVVVGALVRKASGFAAEGTVVFAVVAAAAAAAAVSLRT